MLLHKAVEECGENTFRLRTLLNVNGKNYDKETLTKCLWSSCRRGYFNPSEMLVEAGANVRHVNTQGKSLIMLATVGKHDSEDVRLKLIQFLLEKGADPNVVDIYNKTALHYSVEFEQLKMSTFLVGFYSRVIVSEALFVSVARENVDLVRMLLAKGADPDQRLANGMRAIIVAICKQNVEIFKLLLYRGVDVHAGIETGATPLHFASRLSPIMLHLLLQRKVDLTKVSRKGNNALHYAVESGNVECVHLLLEAGVRVNEANHKGVTPLVYACMNNYNCIAKMLLGRGCSVKPTFQHCPLAQSVWNQNLDLIDTLLAHGATPEKISNDTFSVLLCDSVDLDPSFPIALIERGFNTICWAKACERIPELKIWAQDVRKNEVAAFFAFLYMEATMPRPVPIPRRLTAACGLYPIKRRLLECLAYTSRKVRATVRSISSTRDFGDIFN